MGEEKSLISDQPLTPVHQSPFPDTACLHHIIPEAPQPIVLKLKISSSHHCNGDNLLHPIPQLQDQDPTQTDMLEALQSYKDLLCTQDARLWGGKLNKKGTLVPLRSLQSTRAGGSREASTSKLIN